MAKSIYGGYELRFIAGIVPKEKIDRRIIENASQTTDANSICSYVKYFLENNLDLKLLNFDIKEKVREFLLTNNDYYARKLVELLYSNDFIFLQEIIDINYLRPKKYFLDFVLGILIKQGGFDIVEKYLKNNYNALIKNDIMEEHTIIKNLIMANSDLGFKNLKTIIEKNPEQYVSLDNGYSYKTGQNYSNEKSIDDLIAILNISLLNYDEERINRVHFSPIRISTETIVNICKNANTDFCKIVMDKLNQLDLNKISTSGGDLFFINKLKKDLQEINFNHKSKPYNLKNVLNILAEYNHIFYL